MYRSNVEMIDAIFVVKLVGTGSTFETNLGCPFPIDPMAMYRSEGAFYIYSFCLFFTMHILFIKVKDKLI